MLSSELASWQNGELGSKRVVVEAKLFQWIVMLLRLPGEGNLLLQLVHLRFLQMIRPKGIWLCHRQRLVPPGLCEVGRSCLHTVTEWLCLGRLGYLTDELDLNRLGVTWKLKRLLRTGDDVSETCRTANLQYALVSAMSHEVNEIYKPCHNYCFLKQTCVLGICKLGGGIRKLGWFLLSTHRHFSQAAKHNLGMRIGDDVAQGCLKAIQLDNRWMAIESSTSWTLFTSGQMELK